MSDLLPDEETTRKTYDQSAGLWAKHRNKKDPWRIEYQIFRKLLPKGNILEIGVGAGHDVQNLLDAGYKYTGTDISEGMLGIVRNKFPGQEFYKKAFTNYHLMKNSTVFGPPFSFSFRNHAC